MWQSFHASAKKDAVFIGTATAAVTLPLQMSTGQTSYFASKQGLIKMLEILAAEEENISVRFFHPGVIETDLAEKAGATGVLPIDQGCRPCSSVEIVANACQFNFQLTSQSGWPHRKAPFWRVEWCLATSTSMSSKP